MSPSPSRSHCTSAPAMNALPSSAYDVARVARSPIQRPGDRRQQAARRELRLGADVHQQERARAERALGVAGLGAVLAEQRRLLIAGDAGDRDAVGQAGHALRLAEPARRRADLGQQRRRHAEQRAQLGLEAPRAEVEQQRARRVGDVGDVRLAARQPPDQEAVDGAEGDLAAPRRARAAPRRCPAATRSSSPRSRDRAPGRSARARAGSWPAAFSCGADRRGAPVLPDDGVADRAAVGPVPQHRGLALVGDADGGDPLARRRPSGRRRARP